MRRTHRVPAPSARSDAVARCDGTEEGSVLVLVPVGFLVLLLLAAMAVDSAAVFLGQRQAADAAAGAANDAATEALSSASFYGRGAVEIDPDAAGKAVCQSVAAQEDQDLHDVTVEVASGGPAIEVRIHAEVNAVFGRIVPGFGRRWVTAEATAVAAQGAQVVPADLGALTPVACTSADPTG